MEHQLKLQHLCKINDEIDNYTGNTEQTLQYEDKDYLEYNYITVKGSHVVMNAHTRLQHHS